MGVDLRSWRGCALVICLALGACAPRPAPRACLAPEAASQGPGPAGMVHIPAGVLMMGAAAARPEEGPVRRVDMQAFWIDRSEVTNAQFAAFVAATGYRTLAERGLSARDYPHLSAAERAPASLVFVGAQDGGHEDPSAWWRIVPGADWRHPEGPGSDIGGREHNPVVHVAYEDALAYARWKGRDLPTEAEWEYAARGGLVASAYVWGDHPAPRQKPAANTWQGVFPQLDTGEDGYKAKTAPVGCYSPNGYGLYDMAGNVWEWTRDWYRPGLTPDSARGGPPQAQSLDPDEPGVAKHVVKGGSFLCADDYCFRYRPAARTPGPPDSGSSHVGFRTVLRTSAAG